MAHVVIIVVLFLGIVSELATHHRELRNNKMRSMLDRRKLGPSSKIYARKVISAVSGSNSLKDLYPRNLQRNTASLSRVHMRRRSSMLGDSRSARSPSLYMYIHPRRASYNNPQHQSTLQAPIINRNKYTRQTGDLDPPNTISSNTIKPKTKLILTKEQSQFGTLTMSMNGLPDSNPNQADSFRSEQSTGNQTIPKESTQGNMLLITGFHSSQKGILAYELPTKSEDIPQNTANGPEKNDEHLTYPSITIIPLMSSAEPTNNSQLPTDEFVAGGEKMEPNPENQNTSTPETLSISPAAQELKMEPIPSQDIKESDNNQTSERTPKECSKTRKHGQRLSKIINNEDANFFATEARNFLSLMEEKCSVEYNKNALAQWNYETNITEKTEEQATEATLRMAEFQKFVWKAAKQFEFSDFKDPNLRRQFALLRVLGNAALPRNKLKELNELRNEMKTIYSTARICSYTDQTNCTMGLEEITEVLTYSHDPEELRYVWEAWRTATGRNMKGQFQAYVKLKNEVARLNNFTDSVRYSLGPYGDENFEETVEKLWANVRPLYQELHAYVRRKLRERYGEERVSVDGPIPAHLLGNMWGHTWTNVYNFSLPYPEQRFPDVSAQMRTKGYTVKKLFEDAQQFFQSMNLSAMPPEFWVNSIFEKPSNVEEMVCHGSAWDMFDGKDFRIKMCAHVSLEDYIVVHHEMGHVQYFIQYKDQPIVFREGANPGFHEAIGDVAALSVSTSNHLRRLDLISGSGYRGKEFEMNLLYQMALQKLALLPYSLLMDRWLWDVLRGTTNAENYNSHWWSLRRKYQGLIPPGIRTEQDFDPGAKYHVAAGVPYIRYFASHIIQFQLHKALCLAAGAEDKPLHQCDIYGSSDAGNLLGKMLKMGSSRPWRDAMEVVTGQREMDTAPLLEYFHPLWKWLQEENQRSGEHVGWDGDVSASRRRRQWARGAARKRHRQRVPVNR